MATSRSGDDDEDATTNAATNATTHATTHATSSDVDVRVPAPGEVSRLTQTASVRAREDGAEAIACLTRQGGKDAFTSVEDARDRLLAFHAYAGPEDVGWDPRWNPKPANGGNEIEGVLKLAREEAWTRDLEVFAEEASTFVSDVRAMLPKVEERLAASADGAPLDANERAFVESLLLHRAQQNARAAAIERDMVFARGAALAREINTLESQIREQSAERARRRGAARSGWSRAVRSRGHRTYVRWRAVALSLNAAEFACRCISLYIIVYHLSSL